MRKILIATAGSGGHIFPALALAEALAKSQEAESVFITTENALVNQIRQKGYRVICSKRRSIISLLAFRIYFDIVYLLYLIKKYQFCAVVGFGGYVSIAPIIAAWVLGVPTLIHEQNARFGRANKLLSIFSKKIALGLLNLEKIGNNKKIVYTGNPIRQELKGAVARDEARVFLGLSKDVFTILVMGGSQGSRNINYIFIEALRLLQEVPLQVIHLTGDSDYEFMRSKYLESNIPHKVFKFLDKMVYAYKASDLVVSRAGAMSLTEIAFFNLLAILIPYPYSRGHQEDNARFFNKNNSAFIIKDNDLSAEKLAQYIKETFDNPKRKFNIAQSDAAQNLVQQIKELIDV